MGDSTQVCPPAARGSNHRAGASTSSPRSVAIFCLIIASTFAGICSAADLAADRPVGHRKCNQALSSCPHPQPLISFHAFGKMTETFVRNSHCSDLPCNIGDACTELTFTGRVHSTTFTEPTLTGCINIDSDAENNNGTGGVCSPMSGTATIIGGRDRRLEIAIGGLACTLPNASFGLEASGSYARTNGLPTFGNGHFALSFWQDSSSNSGAGDVDLSGNYVR